MISVIVCTYNRAVYLPRTLEHLAKQSADNSLFEVLIIDNNSKDQTAQIAQDFISRYPKVQSKYFLELNQGLSHARNRGIKEAQGTVLIFIDDDAFVRPNYIQNVNDYFSNHANVSAIGGKIIPVYEAEEPQWMSKYLLPLVAALDLGDSPKRFTGAKFPIGANMGFRKEVFEKHGVFDVNLGRNAEKLEGGEEKDLFNRLKKGNEEIHYVPNVIVDHIIPPKRTNIEYIKAMALGVGISERKRLMGKPFSEKVGKLLSESVKIGGSIVLFVFYFLSFRFQAALLLLRFRYWVLMGMLK